MRNDKRKVRAVVELTPLIDVVFQLLIFFMLSSTFVVQSSIPIEVPEAQGATKLERKDLTVTLSYEGAGPDNSGAVAVQKGDVQVQIQEWGELSNTLAEFRETNPEGLVLIRADARIPTQRLVDVLGIATSVGIERYGIAAAPPPESP